MANEEHLKILRQGVEAWNAWRDENPEVRLELRRDYLHGAKLTGANLIGADLREANLSNATLRGADLSGSDLRDAYLRDAAFIFSANLGGANLDRARLRSLFGGTLVVNVDLRKARDLESAIHDGPSTIGADTLTKSHGKIPEKFLKGCGLNDWQIAAAKLEAPDLTSEQVTDLTYEIDRLRGESPIQINPIFISYSRKDSDFADALEPRLDDKRIRFWRDLHDLKAGRLETQIERAIRHNPIVLLVLSKESVKSDWVQWEARKARELELDQERDVLCPIALDDTWTSCRWPGWLRAQIEEYHILDFSKWEDSGEFDKAFQKLIDGLGIFYPKSASGTISS